MKAQKGRKPAKLGFKLPKTSWLKTDTLKHSRFSKANLIIFAAVFAAIGGYAIYTSFASSPSIICNKTLNSGGSFSTFVNGLIAGDTGCLHTGTYNAGNYTFPNSGTSANPITLASYPGERATVTGSVLYIPAGKNYITIANLDINLSTTVSSVSMQIFGDDITIVGNDITNQHQGETCILLGDYEGSFARVVNRTQITGNKIHGCGKLANGEHDHGIYVAASQDGAIIDNLLYDNQGGWGIQLWTHAMNTAISHNVLDGNYAGNMILAGANNGVGGPSSNNTVSQNIFSFPTNQYNVETYWESGAVGTNNVFTSNCMYGAPLGNFSDSIGYTQNGTVTANPNYVDRPGKDFRLQAGSQCLAVVGYDTAAKLAASDTTPPVVSLTAPVDGTTVTGSSILVSANASDDVGVAGVQFKLDGNNLSSEDTTSPYSVTWDASTLGYGTHTLTAVARDAAGNTTTATAIHDTVSNFTSPLSCSFYASPSGSDSNPGTAGLPVLTVGRLVALLTVSGQVGCLYGGTYTISGSAVSINTAGVSLQSVPGSRALIKGAIWIKNTANNVSIRDLNFDGTASTQAWTISVMGDDVLLSNLDMINPKMHGSTIDGICVSAGYGFETTTSNTAINLTVEKSRIHNCGDDNHEHALYLESTRGAHIVDNYLYDNPGMGLDFYPDAQGTIAEYNVIDGNSIAPKQNVGFAGEQAGGEYSQPHASSNNIVRNSIITNAVTRYNVDSFYPAGALPPSGNSVANSCVWTAPFGNFGHSNDAGGTDYTTSNITNQNPLYVDRLIKNFALQSGSVCLAYAPRLGDSTRPTVSITAPAGGATVSGTITVSANASDNVGVVGVQFKLDGANLSSEDTSSPYSISWNTTTASNGSHSLTAVARDAAGNSTTSSTVTVTVNNTSIPGDCNADGHVTIIDLSILLSHYGQNYSACDFNFDNVVNVFDLSILLSHYGT